MSAEFPPSCVRKTKLDWLAGDVRKKRKLFGSGHPASGLGFVIWGRPAAGTKSIPYSFADRQYDVSPPLALQVKDDLVA